MKGFRYLIFSFLLLFVWNLRAQSIYTHADTLRGSITRERAWWNALHYDLSFRIDTAAKSILGCNRILYKVLKPYNKMQIDLMEPLQIDSVKQESSKLNYTRDGNACFITLQQKQHK